MNEADLVSINQLFFTAIKIVWHNFLDMWRQDIEPNNKFKHLFNALFFNIL